jgi:N-acetylmuramoyl-L-alanine amidase
MDNSKIPTVTVECGFISNESEANDLQDEEYQEKIAWGIYLRDSRLFCKCLNIYK